MAFRLEMQEAITASIALETLVIGLRFEFTQLERTTPFWTSPPHAHAHPRGCLAISSAERDEDPGRSQTLDSRSEVRRPTHCTDGSSSSSPTRIEIWCIGWGGVVGGPRRERC
ncbi:hypothetical protein PRUPE_4G169400 [Prunus persica]|uniref:Uncharacterized protein n=1 Tax=Prunus persica TaxID=3760 RepID=A0A251PN58_PRUPE|nr:hypothetical protein PRUPE_4G169400 [Prunus persica]